MINQHSTQPPATIKIQGLRVSNLAIHKYVWIYLTFFPVLPGILGANLAQQLMHALFLPICLTLIIYKEKFIHTRAILYGTAIVCAIIFFYSFTAITMTAVLTVRDITDIVRPAIYFMYFIVPLCVQLTYEEFLKLIEFFKKLIIIQLIISLFIYLPLLWPIVDIFKGRPSNDMALHFYRWSGTYGFPSDFSYLLSFYIFFYTSLIQLKSKISTRDLLILGGCVIALYMSFSRGGIFATAGILMIQILATGLIFRIKALLMVATLTFFVAAYFNSNNPDNYDIYTEYLTSIFTQDFDSSASHRIRELNLAREAALRNPPLGIGPARTEIAAQISVVESFYGYHLIKWGIAGLLIMLSIKITIVGHSISLYRNNKDHESSHEVSAFALSVALITLSEILLFGLSSAITDRLKTLPTYYLFVGYIFMLRAQRNSLKINRQHSQ